MKPKAYQLLERCIEDGLQAGYQRAHKHTDNPAMEDIWNAQLRSIMLEISEWFNFDDTGEQHGI